MRGRGVYIHTIIFSINQKQYSYEIKVTSMILKLHGGKEKQSKHAWRQRHG